MLEINFSARFHFSRRVLLWTIAIGKQSPSIAEVSNAFLRN